MGGFVAQSVKSCATITRIYLGEALACLEVLVP